MTVMVVGGQGQGDECPVEVAVAFRSVAQCLLTDGHTLLVVEPTLSRKRGLGAESSYVTAG
ncbi:hypothetical protein AB0C04_21105 [Micromonospora sp. NPDC048909]|uniref:hypothetical protein n=1 Tax=Micromonospora sp. NPDC048909 TaxID=3155643 RepID=UPI0033F1F085